MKQLPTASAVSLYLNLVISKLSAELGRNQNGWVKTKLGISSISGNDSEETQCLIGDDGLCWIANNYEGGTEALVKFLGYLGITSKTKLWSHVSDHETWVLDAHLGKVNVRDSSAAKQKVFAKLMGITNGCAVVEPSFLTDARATVGEYKLTSVNAPASGKLLFVTGNYSSTNGYAKYHAEQKLLAALKKYNKRGTYYINGCKMPCTTCAGVLLAASGAFAASNILIEYTDGDLDGWRNDNGLPQVTASDIAKVKLADY